MLRSCYLGFGKSLFDRSLALLMMILAMPLLVLLAVVIRWRLGTPVLFRQKRIGLHGREFTILKFRTMKDARDAEGNLLSDAERLTALGRFLRSTSLDELPELWNVLRGEMSLVGPRPLLPEYLPRYSAEQARRHDVRPGLTGLAQVSGRNQLDWESRFQLDVHYVEHVSPWLDLSILARTVLAVVSRSGVSAEGHATMPPFLGSRQAQLPDFHSGVVVLGAGGHAKVVIATLQAAGQTVLAAYDDDPRQWGKSLLGVPIRGSLALAKSEGARNAIIGIGDNEIRRRISVRFDCNWVAAIHPSAVVHSTVELGPGSLVCAGVVIQPDAQIGEHAIVNTSATVDHDCVLEPYTSIGPGAHLAGNVSVGHGTAIGIGACVIPGVAIGEETIVGAGTVVIADLPANVVAVGSPARIVRDSRTLQVA
ncbi:MAG: NeuD/PglB/VioB family sugar acetyltransferase [Planctomycetes bacterium]|nr:NeuD/PglB/VioB family sugar acetyltransferase [Planctomycetota bacterium]